MITKANDHPGFMTGLIKCLASLHEKGFSDQFQGTDSGLLCLQNGQTYQPGEIRIVNFYRFEGISDPSDMSILYAIRTSDGRQGSLIDAYGVYSDSKTGELMKKVESIQKVAPHEPMAA